MPELDASLTEAFHTGVPAIIDRKGSVQIIDHPESLMSYLFSEKKNLKTVISSRIQIFDNNLCYFAHSSECFSLYVGRVTSNANGPSIVPPCVLDKMQTPCACCFSKTSAVVLTDT